jgi:hypothetical protein
LHQKQVRQFRCGLGEDAQADLQMLGATAGRKP